MLTREQKQLYLIAYYNGVMDTHFALDGKTTNLSSAIAQLAAKSFNDLGLEDITDKMEDEILEFGKEHNAVMGLKWTLTITSNFSLNQ